LWGRLIELQSVRDREKQIVRIVDDNGFNFWVFLVAASGFLASSFALFSTNVIMPSLYYLYDACASLGDNAGIIIDELTYTGTILGMLIMGHLADRSGRKRLYGLELAVLIIATMGAIQASEGYMVGDPGDSGYHHAMDIYSWICWWRLFLGFGIGAEQVHTL